jgi:hypothetical protein
MTRNYTLSEKAIKQRVRAGSATGEAKAAAGAIGGSATSEAKGEASRTNGRRGGRPKSQRCSELGQIDENSEEPWLHLHNF